MEVNRFVAGLVTDASPLTSPENSSYDEDNFVLNIDGSRSRRYGMDYEFNFSNIQTDIAGSGEVAMGVTSYRWDNAGGDPSISILVIQLSNEIRFFNLDEADISISPRLFHTEVMPNAGLSMKASYAVVDGVLVVVNGSKEVYLFDYDVDANTISLQSRKLLIRDLFGVEDIYEGIDIGRGQDMQTRPANYTFAHLYNLRNQSWGVPRIRGNDEEFEDPVTIFNSANSVWPSNTDTVTEALYADPNDTDDRLIDRFFAEDLFKNPLGTSHAPMGYFIIDALDRGTSRLSQEANNRARHPQITVAVETLPEDSTPGGPLCVTEFSGRIFYAGFPGKVLNGDSHSPKMSSYILFSKVVESISDITLCYQEGDPTSKQNPDIIDTDGGFLRVNGAYGIRKLINLGSSLMVIATNGVWRVFGGEDSGFTAGSYIIEKISDRGCSSIDSVVQIDSSVMFWGDDGIYHVTTNEFDSWVCNNISFGRIQKLYDSISTEDKSYAIGQYDSFERKARWLWNARSNSVSETRELILDLGLEAYYTNTINRFSENHDYPMVIGSYVALPYQVNDNANLLVNKADVFHREVGYICLTSNDEVARFTFCRYHERDFRDWKTVDGVGVDAPAYMETSFLSGGDFQRMKQAPYITTYLKRTEDGWDLDPVRPFNGSSCIVQSKWGWTDSDVSGKWGRPFQAYRYRRPHIPNTVQGDRFETGHMLISTKNKLRGRGRVLSLRFSTEPYKDLQLYGWSLIISVKETM